MFYFIIFMSQSLPAERKERQKIEVAIYDFVTELRESSYGKMLLWQQFFTIFKFQGIVILKPNVI